MNDIIKSIIKKRQKYLAERLEKKKDINLNGFFIINTEAGPSEIIIPGVDLFAERKHALPAFVKMKWLLYCEKKEMDLLYVLIESHVFMSMQKAPSNLQSMSENERKKYAKEAADKLPCPPSEDPNAIKAIGFMLFGKDSSMGYMYPYTHNRKHIVFNEKEMVENFIPFGNFENMYPIK